MDSPELISGIKKRCPDFSALDVSGPYPDEVRIKVEARNFKAACLALHKMFSSPVMTFFASDERNERGVFVVHVVFLEAKKSRWVMVVMDIPEADPRFDSLAKSIYSASLFERQIKEMFGIEPEGNPDLRRLHLHDEVWPAGQYPLRRDFTKMSPGALSEYAFGRVEGEGIFEVPVGPVHAGIIGPGHFRFSAAGEPIINLELRLGFTHRGAEKLFEGRSCFEALRLSECVSGDAAFAHSLAFAEAAEKIMGVCVPVRAACIRAVLSELERLHNHISDMGGMALDVGFSFPSAYASVIKEALLQVNEMLTGSRYLKKVNAVGGVLVDIDEAKKTALLASLREIKRDFHELAKMLLESVSFMDRVDTTGVLRKKTAEDLGMVGLAARASGVAMDLRQSFGSVYKEAGFKIVLQVSGDVLARLRVRIGEVEESFRLIEILAGRLASSATTSIEPSCREGSALGCAEGWRGPVLYWLKTDAAGSIQRCKITDASFHNWQGLSYAVLGNIIPDFPLCNKSFNLSYAGNDL